MKTMKNSKKNETRVLIASLSIAAVAVAGATFAWFTSKDEVTNRLSASANYDVSIAEDFQPPEDWIPGQEINKDVSAVNTGNVDAFVRMWLGGQMRLLKEDAAPSVDATTATATSGVAAVTDADKVALGLTYSKDGKYYKTLSTDKIANPNDLAHPGVGNETADPASGENQAAGFSEVQSVQAGGVLVYAPDKAKYRWTLEQATEMTIYTSDTDTTGTVTNLAKGTVVSTYNSLAANKISPKDTNYYGAIDASTFQPETTGLYIFRRNIAETADGTENTYEYSGYYYDATLGKYFALHTGTGANGKSDYVLPAGAVTEATAAPSANLVLPVTLANVKLFTATEQVIETGTAATNLNWAYDNTAGKEKFTVTYSGADGTADDIVIDVALANIGTDSEKWTALGAGAATTFYYNNDVEAGDTTTKLVDSVKLSDATTQHAYLAFDFDLNVFLESVQVTMDDTGKELTTPVTPWNGTAGVNTGATTEDTAYNPDSEISVVGWKAQS